jgi:transposase
MPAVNTNCMNVFLQELSMLYKGMELFVIMDQAGWHKSNDLQIPDNIEIIYLPPYSPELNPVEKFWQHLKQNIIKNKIYQTLNDIKNATADFIISLTQNAIMNLTKKFLNYVNLI